MVKYTRRESNIYHGYTGAQLLKMSQISSYNQVIIIPAYVTLFYVDSCEAVRHALLDFRLISLTLEQSYDRHHASEIVLNAIRKMTCHQGWGSLHRFPISSVPSIFPFLNIIKLPVTYWISQCRRNSADKYERDLRYPNYSIAKQRKSFRDGEINERDFSNPTPSQNKICQLYANVFECSGRENLRGKRKQIEH